MLIATLHKPSELTAYPIWGKADLLELRLDLLGMGIEALKSWKKTHSKPLLITHPHGSFDECKMWLELEPEWMDIPLTWSSDTIEYFCKFTNIVRSAHLNHTQDPNVILKQLLHPKASHFKCVVQGSSTLAGLQALELQKNLANQPFTVFAQGQLAQFTRALTPHWGGWEYTYVHEPITSGQYSTEEAYTRLGNKYRYALIGHQINHSLSPKFHNSSFQKQQHPGTYIKLDIPPNEFDEAIPIIKRLKFHGLSITSPYKLIISNHFDNNKDPINTIVRAHHTYRSSNTDGAACIEILKSQSLKTLGIIGLGGTGVAIAKAAKQHDIKTVLCNRTDHKAQQAAIKLGTEWVCWDQISKIMSCDCLLLCLPRQVSPPKAIQFHPNCHTINYNLADSETSFGKQLFYAQARLQNNLWINSLDA